MKRIVSIIDQKLLLAINIYFFFPLKVPQKAQMSKVSVCLSINIAPQWDLLQG